MGRGHVLGEYHELLSPMLECSLIMYLDKAGDGSRQPTDLELEIATEQGKAFYGHVSKVSFA